MSKDIEIRLNKCILVLSEKDLIECLSVKPGLMEQSIKKGKYLIRHDKGLKRQLRRNAENYDRWQIYELLKSNIKVDNDGISYVEGMDKQELREGVIEFLLMRNRIIS